MHIINNLFIYSYTNHTHTRSTKTTTTNKNILMMKIMTNKLKVDELEKKYIIFVIYNNRHN